VKDCCSTLPTALESRDDRAYESTLKLQSVSSPIPILINMIAYLDAIRLDSNEAVDEN
jgi:hypothetical protein